MKKALITGITDQDGSYLEELLQFNVWCIFSFRSGILAEE